VVESQPRAGFCAGPLEPQSSNTPKNLEIYETNTSNYPQSERSPELSADGLQLSTDQRIAGQRSRGACGNEGARFSQVKQRIIRRRSRAAFYRRTFILHSDQRRHRLADYVDAARDHSNGEKLLREIEQSLVRQSDGLVLWRARCW
jgi:hypothetical protein